MLAELADAGSAFVFQEVTEKCLFVYLSISGRFAGTLLSFCVFTQRCVSSR
jgi:hypothetical protein